MLAPDIVPVHSKNVVTRKDSGGMLLFQVRTDEMHFISHSAYLLFALCNGSRTIAEIEELLAHQQPELATPEARKKIEGFINSLAERQVVELWR